MAYYRKKKLFFFVLLYAIAFGAYAQDITLKGVIKDSLVGALPNANILAFPALEKAGSLFAISNAQGHYKLKLKAGVGYRIEISYLGYRKKSFDFFSKENTYKEILLVPAVTALDGVVLSYKIPVQVKEDTVIYNTDAFVNGKEIKLRDVLKKLPGIEVDRDGNVTALGKKINKFLVEDKIFFTGDSKLAVNNIPADAVDKVVVLDNYSEIGFLKGLVDSQEMAMNIKLKKDKKNFVFGDLDGAVGLENRHLLHSNLFYYSAKTNINTILDANNVGQKAFTLSDYLDFEGGFGNLMERHNGGVSNLKETLTQFGSNESFIKNDSKFGAINLTNEISDKLTFAGYIITGFNATKDSVVNLNTFLNNTNLFNETRTQDQLSNRFFSLAKFSLEHKKTANTNLKINSFFKISNNNINGNTLTTSPFANSLFNTYTDNQNIEVKQNLTYNKKASYNQTHSLESTITYNNLTPTTTELITDQPFLNTFYTLENDTLIKVVQDKKSENFSFNFLYKNYWVLNSYHHIYTTIGGHLSTENFKTNTTQQSVNNNALEVSPANFNNHLNYELQDYFLGSEYKFLKSIFTTKLGLFYHYYILTNTQETQKTTLNVPVFLPEFSVEAKLNKKEKLRFNYSYNIRIPQPFMLAQNPVLNSFNAIFKGDRNTKESYFHALSLNYTKFNLIKDYSISANLFYNKKTQSIKNKTELNGIDQFISLVNFYEPENSITARFNFNKRLQNLSLSLNQKANYREFYQWVDEDISLNITKGFSTTAKAETYFEKWPNITLGYTYELSNYKNNTFNTTFTNAVYFSKLDWVFLENFQFLIDYQRQQYRNNENTINNNFDIANAALSYKNEGSRWRYEISGTNLFNRTFNRSNTLSDLLLTDQQQFVMPRILLFKLSYKL